MKKVLFVTSEAVPFAKTGGLADVAGSLPRYFNKREYDVRIIMPRYESMNQRGELNKLVPKIRFYCHFYVNLNWRKQYVGMYLAEYEGVTYYFIDNDYYFSGDRLYEGVEKDIERFAFFSKAVLEALKYLDWNPQILHCNDWQSALVPVFLKAQYNSNSFYKGIKTILTIHNLRYQGRWDINAVQDITGLPSHLFTAKEMEYYGCANLLKGGIVYADEVTTVSPTYAKEILTPEGGEGLDGVLRANEEKLHGILNGIDYKEYDPMEDLYVDVPYNVRTVASVKNENKAVLQKICNMPIDKEIFTIGMVTRLTNQKGMDLVVKVLDQILDMLKVQVYILASGDKEYEEFLVRCEQKYPNVLHTYIGYSEELASKIYSGCDAFLMPSMFEPCGLSQIISMRYGTLPIVRETGGLKDTVVPYNAFSTEGTGFSFCDYNEYDMLYVIKLASDIYYYKPERWVEMQVQAMNVDFTWEQSARKYEEIYDSLIVDPFA